MTFLQVCQRLGQEAAIGNMGNPSDVVSQVGEEKRIVDWVATVYEDVQNLHLDWNFLRTSFSFAMTSGTGAYPTTSVTNYASWDQDGPDTFRTYLTASGISDEQVIQYVAWEDYRTAYLLASQRTTTGRPTIYTIKPDESLLLWPIPDDDYTLVGEYFILPDIMAVSGDIPIIPPRFHMVLVWGGLMFYGAYSAEPDKYAFGEDRYEKILRKLEIDQLPQLSFGESLA